MRFCVNRNPQSEHDIKKSVPKLKNPSRKFMGTRIIFNGLNGQTMTCIDPQRGHLFLYFPNTKKNFYL